MTIMFTTGEQRELHQIEQGLRESDRGFARRLTVLQGMLRWAAPGRRAYLPVLAMLAAALLRLAAATGRLLMTFAEGAALMALGDAAWPGWESGQEPDRGASPARGRPQPSGTDL